MNTVIARLKKVNGQINGIIKMIDEKKDCEEIVVQFQAAKAALDGAFSESLDQNLTECLQKKDKTKMKRMIKLIAKK